MTLYLFAIYIRSICGNVWPSWFFFFCSRSNKQHKFFYWFSPMDLCLKLNIWVHSLSWLLRFFYPEHEKQKRNSHVTAPHACWWSHMWHNASVTPHYQKIILSKPGSDKFLVIYLSKVKGLWVTRTKRCAWMQCYTASIQNTSFPDQIFHQMPNLAFFHIVFGRKDREGSKQRVPYAMFHSLTIPWLQNSD